MFGLFTSLFSNLYLWLWLLGVLFVWLATKRNRSARRWGIVLLIAFWLIGTRPVADGILWPLESRYAAPDIASLQKMGVRQVVVLTGGGYQVQGEMLSSAFPHASAYRFLGGLELASRLGPDCKMIFSGSAGRGRNLETASDMQNLSRLLNPGRQVFAETRSGSTAEHPANVKVFVKDEPFVLVTSALHMPRSYRTFHKAGLNPIPYPVDFLMTGNLGWMDWLPSIENLWKVNNALREYQALLLYAVWVW